MGVDTSLMIRIYTENQEKFKEIKITDQDNSLASLFYSDEIHYTSIKFDRKKEISDEENELINLSADENDEEQATLYSKIFDAHLAYDIFKKIHNKLYRPKRLALADDLIKIDSLQISEEDKGK